MGSDSQGQLEAWVRGVTDAAISFDAPSSAPETGPVVGLYLLEMRGQLPLSPARPDVRQVDLGYLVTTWADEPGQAHDLLVDLCFAAMDQQGMEVEIDPPEVRAVAGAGRAAAAVLPGQRLTAPRASRARCASSTEAARPRVGIDVGDPRDRSDTGQGRRTRSPRRDTAAWSRGHYRPQGFLPTRRRPERCAPAGHPSSGTGQRGHSRAQCS